MAAQLAMAAAASQLAGGIFALDALGRRPPSAPDREALRDAGEGARRIVVCTACRGRVTDSARRSEVGGHHEHTFFNPAGIAFRIACYDAAPGCAGVGEWSDEFTWFAGHRWQVGVCAACGQHLGWHFDGPTRFTALIRDRIRELEA